MPRLGLGGRDVYGFADDALGLLEHELVEAPEEGGEGFASAGGGEDEGGVAAGDGGPALLLGQGGRFKDLAEPLGGDGVELEEGVGGGFSLWCSAGLGRGDCVNGRGALA